MAEMTLDRAIRIYAEYVAASQCERAEWENFPDIGEHDWQRVLDELPTFPLGEDFRAAEAFLIERVGIDEPEEEW